MRAHLVPPLPVAVAAVLLATCITFIGGPAVSSVLCIGHDGHARIETTHGSCCQSSRDALPPGTDREVFGPHGCGPCHDISIAPAAEPPRPNRQLSLSPPSPVDTTAPLTRQDSAGPAPDRVAGEPFQLTPHRTTVLLI